MIKLLVKRAHINSINRGLVVKSLSSRSSSISVFESLSESALGLPSSLKICFFPLFSDWFARSVIYDVTLLQERRKLKKSRKRLPGRVPKL